MNYVPAPECARFVKAHAVWGVTPGLLFWITILILSPVARMVSGDISLIRLVHIIGTGLMLAGVSISSRMPVVLCRIVTALRHASATPVPGSVEL